MLPHKCNGWQWMSTDGGKTGRHRECTRPLGHDGDCEWGDWLTEDYFPFALYRTATDSDGFWS